MKEVMAVIRMNKINETKVALSNVGFSAITCRKVYGRGKKKVNYELIQDLMSEMTDQSPEVLETVSENHRLIAKRFLTLIVQDDEVKRAVDTIIKVNQTGNMGDGRIFIMPINEVVRIRTNETGELAV